MVNCIARCYKHSTNKRIVNTFIRNRFSNTMRCNEFMNVYRRFRIHVQIIIRDYYSADHDENCIQCLARFLIVLIE